jgi:hypothetical protein
MKDIFDAEIVCKKCKKEMGKVLVERGGFHLRAMKCPKCGDELIHPTDLEKFKRYEDMRGKTYNVKLRVVGNSHAISIPKEILDFVNGAHRDMKKQMDDMVKLCFEDFGKLSLNFFNGSGKVHKQLEGDR